MRTHDVKSKKSALVKSETTSPRIVTDKQHRKTYVDVVYCTVNTFIHKHPKSTYCPLISWSEILLEVPFHESFLGNNM
jgi:hypothetical protein